MPLEQAQPIAEQLRDFLAPACHRIEVAGSIRRQKALVADVEIVAMPRVESRAGSDLWKTPSQVDLLDELIGMARESDLIAPRDVAIRRASGTIEHQVRLGDAYKALVYRGLPVDLFIVRDPEQWGVIFALRTGPGDWNTRLVTDCKRYLRRVEGGHVYVAGQRVPCPEEGDFFRAIGQRWIEPPDRHVGRVRIEARLEVPA